MIACFVSVVVVRCEVTFCCSHRSADPAGRSILALACSLLALLSLLARLSMSREKRVSWGLFSNFAECIGRFELDGESGSVLE